MGAHDWYRWDGDTLVLRLRVQPRARCTGFAEPHGDALKVKLKAPPVDGRANDELVAFLAERFGVARTGVALISGKQGRTKQLRIQSPSRLPPEISR